MCITHWYFEGISDDIILLPCLVYNFPELCFKVTILSCVAGGAVVADMINGRCLLLTERLMHTQAYVVSCLSEYQVLGPDSASVMPAFVIWASR